MVSQAAWSAGTLGASTEASAAVLRWDAAVYGPQWPKINWLLERLYISPVLSSLAYHVKSKCINGPRGPLIPNLSRHRRGG